CLHRMPHAAASQTLAGTATSITMVRPTRRRDVASVETETKRSTRAGYFVALGLTLLGIAGVVLAGTAAGIGAWDMGDAACPLVSLNSVLAILLLWPV